VVKASWFKTLWKAKRKTVVKRTGKGDLLEVGVGTGMGRASCNWGLVDNLIGIHLVWFRKVALYYVIVSRREGKHDYGG
jgi:hypothetical protein